MARRPDEAGKLTLLDGESEILPGLRAVPAHDTHTAGSQYVTIENDRDGRWLLAGDNCYVYENFTGPATGASRRSGSCSAAWSAAC